MIVYHGTTQKRAQRICAEGFLPKKPSRRVWFAESRGYALGRAKTQARRTRDRAVVLTCNIDLGRMRRYYGNKKVFHRGGIVAIDGPVGVHVLRSSPSLPTEPSSPAELAAWVNQILGLKPHKGVSPKHPGIDRLARWIANRVSSEPRSRIRPTELLALSRRWLAEYFDGIEIDPDTLRIVKRVSTVEVEVEDPDREIRAAEDKALGLLLDPKGRRRVKGLKLLAHLRVPDLFDWCVMCLNDPSKEVRVSALRQMRHCEEADTGVILPLAQSEDKLIRAAGIAAMARHAGEDAPRWCERGLRDPDPCVRLETTALLADLDPAKNRSVFELALHDPNAQIQCRARKLIAGKGFSGTRWRRPKPTV